MNSEAKSKNHRINFMVDDKDTSRLMFLNSKDGKFSNEESNKGSPIWIKDATILERH